MTYGSGHLGFASIVYVMLAFTGPMLLRQYDYRLTVQPDGERLVGAGEAFVAQTGVLLRRFGIALLIYAGLTPVVRSAIAALVTHDPARHELVLSVGISSDEVVVALIGALILVFGSVMADATRIGLTEANVSLLKSGRVKGVRFETLEKICEVLDCQPGDILEYRHDPGAVPDI